MPLSPVIREGRVISDKVLPSSSSRLTKKKWQTCIALMISCTPRDSQLEGKLLLSGTDFLLDSLWSLEGALSSYVWQLILNH